MIKCKKYNDVSTDKSPYVYDGSCLTIYRTYSLADVPLLQLVQAHVEVGFVGVDVRGHRHPRAADILKLKGNRTHKKTPISTVETREYDLPRNKKGGQLAPCIARPTVI